MTNKLQMPKYKCSIVNLVSSILNHYGVSTKYDTIDEVSREFEKNYSHIVLFVFDGLGSKSLNYHLDNNSCLRKHIKQEIQSVFPPTTTAAMTSYYTGEAPCYHGWLGWSLYFRRYGTMIDVFTNANSYTGDSMKTQGIAYKELPYTNIFEKIDRMKHDKLKIHSIMPEEIKFQSNPNIHHPVTSLNDILETLKSITSEKDDSFTMAYWDELDAIMHKKGPYDDEVGEEIGRIDDFVKSLSGELNDSLIIVCADHGQIEIHKEYYIDEDNEIDEMLVIPPCIEPRCVSFFVKDEFKEVFRDRFNAKYGDEFKLFSNTEVKDMGLFGRDSYNRKFSNFVGDYIACGIGNSLLRYKTIDGRKGNSYKGHHAGLTEEEMLIPLILINSNEN